MLRRVTNTDVEGSSRCPRRRTTRNEPWLGLCTFLSHLTYETYDLKYVRVRHYLGPFDDEGVTARLSSYFDLTDGRIGRSEPTPVAVPHKRG